MSDMASTLINMGGQVARVQAISPRPDGTYRFAVKARADENTQMTVDALGTWGSFEIGTEWETLELTVVNPTGDYIDLYPHSDAAIYIKEMQLNYGRDAYDWRPAPEDEDETFDWRTVATDEETLAHIRDIASRTAYFRVELAASTKPSKPTTNPPGAGWSTEEPLVSEIDEDKYSLYRSEITVFSDGTFEWSDVTLVTTYEVARNVSSQLKQLEDEFETRVLATYVDQTTGETVATRMTDLVQTQDQLTRLVEKVDKTAGDFEEKIQLVQTTTAKDITNIFTQSKEYTDNLRQDVDDGYGAAKQYAETAQTWQRFSADGIEQGALNSPFKSKLSSTELGFYENNRRVSYINNNRFYITNGQIDDTLRIGQFMFAKSGNGLGLLNISGGTSV